MKRSIVAEAILGLSLASPVVLAEPGNPRVNQVGYLPQSAKIATYVHASDTALAWELLAGNAPVASGVTEPLGLDSASGDSVHRIDFSEYAAPGARYRLRVGDDRSYPFVIDDRAYSAPLYDALRYFYHNRSGIEIETAHTGGGLGSYAADEQWARPAGHLNTPPNQGDLNVPCWPGTCDYRLDVTRGWYDAGDHGKYVVNGGISVWKLLNAYERAHHQGEYGQAFADGRMNIPESGNGVPDLLDEVLWQLEFMLAMQVPAGHDNAGMVHHKMHNEGWTGLPTAPHENANARYLVPPSTPATLNLAAVAAQCARIWADIDSSFADRCRSAATTAWQAALDHPDTYYQGGYDNGGGGYDDSDVSDEFAWAATELFITTGDEAYLNKVETSADSSTWSWQDTRLAGVLSLATVPTEHSASERDQARATVIDLADGLVNTTNGQGYPVPLTTNEYIWGSNNLVANRLVLIGSAYDYSGETRFADAFGQGLDYLFGRNALSLSYITGHGEHATRQPHHRFWAGALNDNYPWAPPGAMAGGPNTGLEDGVSSAALKGCLSTPQRCYLDDIDAWSTNEITINWNSALVWVLAFYDDYAGHEPTDPGGNGDSGDDGNQGSSGDEDDQNDEGNQTDEGRQKGDDRRAGSIGLWSGLLALFLYVASPGRLGRRRKQ